MLRYDKIAIQRLLNSGRDSSVYCAEVLPGGRFGASPWVDKLKLQVACKICPHDKIGPVMWKIAELVSRRPHRHLETVFGVLPGTDTFCYTLCKKLAKTLAHYDRQTDPSLENISRDIFDGLEFLHRHEIAHCDIKINNLMLDFQGRAVVIDFNNAQPSSLFGTFPLGTTTCERHVDLMINPTDWDYRIDCWATGATIFYLATGGHYLLDLVLGDTRIPYETVDSCKPLPASTACVLRSVFTRYLEQLKQGDALVLQPPKRQKIFQIIHFLMTCTKADAINLALLESLIERES